MNLKTNNNDELFLKQVFDDKPVAYRPVIAKALGSINAGLLVSQLYYWKDKGQDKDGWIYKTRKDLRDELGLSRAEQDTAREKARNMGVISEVIKKMPPKVHFKINTETLANVIKNYLKSNGLETSQFVCKYAQNVQTVGPKTSPTTGEIMTKRKDENQPNFYTENTTKNTKEITAEKWRRDPTADKYARFNK